MSDNETKQKSTITQTGGTTTSPYPGAKPLLDTGLNSLSNLFKTNKLAPYAGLNAMQDKGLKGIYSSALAGVKPMDQAIGLYQKFAGGGGDISSQGQADIASKAMGPSYAEQNLGGVARGDNLGAFDPNYERLRQRAMENASTEASMQAGGMGRTGSDYHQTAVARQVGDTVAGMDYNRLQDERTRQVEANSLMDTMRQAGLGIGLNATNSKTAIDTGNKDRMMTAAGQIPGAVNAKTSLYDQIAGVGDVYQADKQAKLGGGANNLQALLESLGFASPYGTTVSKTTGTTDSTTKEPKNTLGKVAGGGLSLLSLLMG